MPDGMNLTTPAELSLLTLVLNLLIGAVISVALSMHFVRFGRTMSNRRALAQVFPLIVLTTVLVISVVKSSLALSLGLVGALSIVRFRTPIKEPEELAYLFMAIGMGLGLGADHRVSTVTAGALILLILTARDWLMKSKRDHNLYLNIEIPDGGAEGTLEMLTDLLSSRTKAVDARRFDLQDGQLHATFVIECSDDHQLMSVMNELRAKLPGASISFVDQSTSLFA